MTMQALLKEFANAQDKQTAVKEEVMPPPSPRSNGTLTAHPTKDELIYFGGEHLCGKQPPRGLGHFAASARSSSEQPPASASCLGQVGRYVLAGPRALPAVFHT